MKRNVKAGARLVQSLGRNKAASDMDGLMECLYCPRGVYMECTLTRMGTGSGSLVKGSGNQSWGFRKSTT